jgi:hypothetical protein
VPVEAKPLFRPDVLRPHLAEFHLPGDVPAIRETFGRWASLLWSPQADTLKDKELLPDFLTDVFCGILGYTRAADNKDRYTFSGEKFVQVDGKFADAVLGELNLGRARVLVAVERKGPKDPLDRPFAGRKMSAVDRGYRYAINLPSDWIVVTSMRQTMLYHKGSEQDGVPGTPGFRGHQGSGVPGVPGTPYLGSGDTIPNFAGFRGHHTWFRGQVPGVPGTPWGSGDRFRGHHT